MPPLSGKKGIINLLIGQLFFFLKIQADVTSSANLLFSKYPQNEGIRLFLRTFSCSSLYLRNVILNSNRFFIQNSKSIEKKIWGNMGKYGDIYLMGTCLY
jgi:hypothetical protein